MDLKEKTIMVRTNLKPIDIIFRNVTYSVSSEHFKRVRKRILNGLSGDFKSGEMTAILGPSGAGKTSLLNILTGFDEANIGGFIRAVDKSEKAQYVKVRREDRCFILQEDELSPSFTVREIMMMASNLKLGGGISQKKKLEIIEDILDAMKLKKTEDTQCKRLSGGEKKRLAIALELINNPPVMFLDEPTTGLDSASCLQCITLLRKLATGGRNIICTIHQPSALIFEMFDHVYVIADGACVYQGTPSNVIPFLQSVGLCCPRYHNPADFIIEVVNGEYGDFNSKLVEIASKPCWRSVTSGVGTSNYAKIEKYTNPNEPIKEIANSNEFYVMPTEYQRFFALLESCAMKSYRNWITCHTRITAHLLIAIFVAIIYADCGENASRTFSNIGFLVATTLYLSYSAVMSGVVKFLNELSVIRKERFNNWYELTTFYLAFLVVDIPKQIVFTMVFVIPAYYLTSQILNYERFLKFSLICILINLLSEGIGLIFGTIISLVNGVFLGTICACFFLAFAGFHILLPHMTTLLYYVSYASCYRYAFTGLLKALYGNNRAPLNCPESEIFCILKYPNDILKYFGVEEDGYFINVLIMCWFIIFFYVMAFFSLKYRVRYGYFF